MAEKLDGKGGTARVWTQAQAYLRYSAFIELNQRAIVDVMSRDDEIKLYQGWRVLAIEGSKIGWPRPPRVVEEFGEIGHDKMMIHGVR